MFCDFPYTRCNTLFTINKNRNRNKFRSLSRATNMSILWSFHVMLLKIPRNCLCATSYYTLYAISIGNWCPSPWASSYMGLERFFSTKINLAHMSQHPLPLYVLFDLCPLRLHGNVSLCCVSIYKLLYIQRIWCKNGLVKVKKFICSISW